MEPPRSIKILYFKMYYLNTFQYLLNLLQSLLYPLHGIKASMGYLSPPSITFQHRASPYKKEKESIPYYHMNLPISRWC